MKHVLALAVSLLVLVGIYFFIQYNSEPISFTQTSSKNSPPAERTIIQSPKETMLFVPYWGLGSGQLPTTYDTFIYFGIVPTSSGINTDEDGYKSLPHFVQKTGNKKMLLTVRMVDTQFNTTVLQSKIAQQHIISQSVDIAKKYGFSGIVLDLEYSALSFDSVIRSISAFSADFAKQTHSSHLLFYQSVYGDTFYRLRPYDTEALAKNADGLFILAYDFHKATGDPGPNFPLHGKANQGYDLVSMIEDFSKKIPTKKLIVTFGMYGYDWSMDDKGHSIATANPLTLLQIQQKFLESCSFSSCIVARDDESSETEIRYKDSKKISHEVWFEDKDSVAEKKTYLHTQGINQIAFWAYSYF